MSFKILIHVWRHRTSEE